MDAQIAALSVDVQQLRGELQQLREYTNDASSPLAGDLSTQTPTLQTVENDLQTLYGKADETIRATNIHLGPIKEDKGKHGKEKKKAYWMRQRTSCQEC